MADQNEGSGSTLTPQEPLENVTPFVIGDPGNVRYSGYFHDEPNADWRDERRCDNVEEMRSTDATVQGLLTALKTPILAANWMINAVDDTPEEQEIRDFVELNLFGMARTWKEFLREVLNYFDFGFSVGELCWEFKENRIWLKDIEPRIQPSIRKWRLNDGRRGVVQQILTDESNKHEAEIPMNKLLVLTNNKEGDDPTGKSVLRSAWKHYYYKDKMYRVAGISAERYGVGIPKVTMPKGSTDADKDAAYTMGQEIRANEMSVIVLPNEDWKIEILTPQGNPQQGQIEAIISHHDRMIVMSALAAFLNLGSDSTGSYALSKDQSSFFLKVCEDKALYVAEQIMKQVINRLVQLNYGERKKYPTLAFTALGDIDFGEYSTMLATLVNAGLLDVDGKVKQFVRKNFKLPELTDEELEEMEAKKLAKEANNLDVGEEPIEEEPDAAKNEEAEMDM